MMSSHTPIQKRIRNKDLAKTDSNASSERVLGQHNPTLARSEKVPLNRAIQVVDGISTTLLQILSNLTVRSLRMAPCLGGRCVWAGGACSASARACACLSSVFVDLIAGGDLLGMRGDDARLPRGGSEA